MLVSNIEVLIKSLMSQSGPPSTCAIRFTILAAPSPAAPIKQPDRIATALDPSVDIDGRGKSSLLLISLKGSSDFAASSTASSDDRLGIARTPRSILTPSSDRDTVSMAGFPLEWSNP